jgi:hypothetical protein
MNPLKQHPIVTLGVIIFFAVTALVVFRLSSGAKTDTRKARAITVATVAPLKQDLTFTNLYCRHHPQPSRQSVLTGRRLHCQDLRR